MPFSTIAGHRQKIDPAGGHAVPPLFQCRAMCLLPGRWAAIRKKGGEVEESDRNYQELVKCGSLRAMIYAGSGALLILLVTVSASADQVINDDLIVVGSVCVGFDCVNNESFGFDTIRLKENNLRIKFEDTSTIEGFASNDWSIVINDSGTGGTSHFSIVDDTAGETLFRLCAVADTTCTPILPTTIDLSDVESNVAANSQRLDAHEQRLDSLDWRVDRNRRDIDRNKEGVAMALALSGSAYLSASENFSLSANYGHFQGSNAIGFGAAVRVADRISLNGGLGLGLEEDTVGGRAGMRIGW